MFKFFRLLSELSEYILIQDGDDIEVQDNMYIDSENKGRIIVNTKIPHNKTSDFVMNELANINIARTAARNLYGYDPSQGPSRYFEKVTIIPNGDDDKNLIALILTDGNIDILKYYFDKSDYRWTTNQSVSESERYKPGNVLYLYEDGFVYYNELAQCEFKQYDETAVEYLVNI